MNSLFSSTAICLYIFFLFLFVIAYMEGRKEDRTDPEILRAIEQNVVDESIPLEHSTSASYYNPVNY